MAVVRLWVAVQHHPARADLLGQLLERLGDATVVTDPEPAGRPLPWRTYRHALEQTPEWATHALVVQDDARPCAHFPAAAARAAAARPDVVVVFCVCGSPRRTSQAIREAHAAGEHWAPVSLNVSNVFCPVIATSIPTRMITPLLAFSDSPAMRRQTGSDDHIVGAYLRHAGEQAWATVPSLVDHPDDQPSLIGKPHMFGRNTARAAAVFIGDRDPLAIDW